MFQEDEKLLEQKDLPYRLRCVVVMRLSEKRILINASQLAHREREKLTVQLDELKDFDESETSSVENESTNISEPGNEPVNESSEPGNESSEQNSDLETISANSSSMATNGLEKAQMNDTTTSSELIVTNVSSDTGITNIDGQVTHKSETGDSH